MRLYIVRLVDKDSGEVVQTLEFDSRAKLAHFFEDFVCFPDVRYEVTSA
jgi:hypothetical protein